MRNIKPVHTTIILGLAVSAVFLSVIIWWNGASPSAWTTFTMSVATLMAWLPSVVWLVHAYNYVNIDGWDYLGNDVWQNTQYFDGHRMVTVVERLVGGSSYWVSMFADDPFIDNVTQLIKEYGDYDELQEVLNMAEYEAHIALYRRVRPV